MSFVPLPRAGADNNLVNSAGLEAFTRALDNIQGSMRGFILLRNGHVAAERFWPPYKPEDAVHVYSLSKSFTSTAIGLAVDEGLLSVDDLVLKFFPEYSYSDENLNAMRVHDLLTMRSGHQEDTTGTMADRPDGDWARGFLELPVTYKPGTHFVYNTGATYMLSAILQRATGTDMLAYLTPRFFEPLGFGEVAWHTCPKGINTGGWGLMVRLEDVAKLGQLYLDGGEWTSGRIISGQWTQEAVKPHADNSITKSSVDWSQGYGYQFWRCQHGAFRGDGAFGQYCVVMPDRRAVLALMSETDDMQAILDIVWEYLLPALDTANSIGTFSGAHGSAFEYAPEPEGEVSAAENISGLRVRFTDCGVELEFAAGKDSQTLCAGFDDTNFRPHWIENNLQLDGDANIFMPGLKLDGSQPIKKLLEKAAARCYWLKYDMLVVELAYHGIPHRDRLIFTFDNDKIFMTNSTVRWDWGPMRWRGVRRSAL